MSALGIIGEKLAAKGVQPINVRLQIALAEFQNNGGSYGVALAMLNAAYGKGSVGHSESAALGQAKHADASRLNGGDEGLMKGAEMARDATPSSPPTERSEGRLKVAEKADVSVPSATSRHLPGHAKRGAVAIGAVDHVATRSLFDTTVLPDGRKLREVRWSECPALATKYRRLSRVLMAVHNHAIPPEPSMTLDAIVNEAELSQIITSVERFNEIH